MLEITKSNYVGDYYLVVEKSVDEDLETTEAKRRGGNQISMDSNGSNTIL